MRVVIVGASKVTFSLVKQIIKDNVDIVVIDKDAKVIDSITDSFDINGYVGNGASAELLKKAGIDAASLFVALTKSDETNILCCNVAKKLGVKRTVAAVRDPEYKSDKPFILKELGVDLLVNPDMSAAEVVAKRIKYAQSVQIKQFESSKVSVATIKLSEDSILSNTSICDFQNILGVQALICAIERDKKMIVPKGKHSILPGDRITVACIGENMNILLSKLGITEEKVKKTVIVGAGKVGYYLADNLLKMGSKVTIVDNNPSRCKRFLEVLPNAEVVCGDGTDTRLMENELKGADACITMTGRDEENLIISMFAKSIGMDRIAAEIDNENFAEMLRRSGINHAFSTQNVAIDAIIKDMRALVADEDDKDNNLIKWFYNLNQGRVEAVEFELTDEFPLIGIPLKDRKFDVKSGVLIAVIIRDGEAIIPNGESALKTGDHVIIVSSEHKISKLTEILA